MFVFIELELMRGESNYTQYPIKLISMPSASSLTPIVPSSTFIMHEIRSLFDSLDMNTVLENENIYPLLPPWYATIHLSHFSLEKMIFLTAKKWNSQKSFNSSLKMSKSFTSHNLFNFQHNSRPLNDADRMTERKSDKKEGFWNNIKLESRLSTLQYC